MARRRLAIAAAAAALVNLAGFEPLPQARAVVQDQPALSPRNASYRLQAALDPVRHEITGTGRLAWRNISRTTVTELRFHLYWNAWRDARSSWMREQALAGNRALERRPAEDFGGIDVTLLAIGGRNLINSAKFIAPDDGNADDRTVLAVPLEKPVGPGEAVDVDLGWTARVPRTFARTGRLGNYYFVAQWFPKIGVVTESGWNAHQFHAATEFFADFGEYDVTLTVPRGWVVGATGRLVSTSNATADAVQHRFVQADVHDFAWTTSPDFVDRRQRFEEPGLPPVEMRLLLQPEHTGQEERHFKATRAALKYYGSWFGPYPYAQVTIVDPATIFNPSAQGESTGGMEYPTLFTAGTRWWAPWLGTQPESVTVHEAGHQFWYGIVATNEFEDAWMDEGLNTYSTARVLDAAFPNQFVATARYFGGLAGWAYPDVAWSRAIDGNRLNAYRPVASYEDQSTPTWKYWPGSASAITYNKTALWLATMERMLGWEATRTMLSAHFRSGAFRHPTPVEFMAIANEVLGQDLTWFFNAVHRGSATFDYGVGQVTSVPSADGGFTHTVVVRRFGDGVFPTTVRITCGGTVRLLNWDGAERWKAFEVRDAEAITKVEVDPNRVLMLDVNYTNNSWTARPRAVEAASKWALRWFTWAQELLLTYAFFA
jgi:hypothetical protein